MRYLISLASLLLLSTLAAAQQATVVSGYASNWAPQPGVYATPIVPLVSTPSVALDGGQSLEVGARNATLDIAPQNVFAAPAWYGQPAAPQSTNEATNLETAAPAAPQNSGFQSGAARFPLSYGAAQLMSLSQRKSARLYGNQDVEAVNQNNGVVRYRGKTEHMD
jgi:hypothetical protein